MKPKHIIFAGIAGLVVISWSGYQALQWQREKEVAALIQETEKSELHNLKQLMRQWDDTVRLAEFAPRDQLVGLVTRLQEIKRLVEVMSFRCAPMGGTGAMRGGMEMGIGAFLHHMQQASGDFDRSMLDYTHARIKVGTDYLRAECGY